MDRYYFRSPVGIVECLIEESGKILSCNPCKTADNSLIKYAIESHPKLADAFRCISPAPPQYTLDLLAPIWAPHFWLTLSQIPYGATLYYSELASRLGLSSGFARVIGSQLGRNKHFLLLPCHRVIKSDHTLGGYKWGTQLKRKILDYEQNGQANRYE